MRGVQDEGVRHMELRRRPFIRLLVGLGVAWAAGLGGRPGRLVPDGCAEAARAARYPGPLKALSEEEMRKPGRWGG